MSEPLKKWTAWYRRRQGIALALPLNFNQHKTRRPAGPSCPEGQPADCRIKPAGSLKHPVRPERCFYCDPASYEICLSFAAKHDWRGWKILNDREAINTARGLRSATLEAEGRESPGGRQT